MGFRSVILFATIVENSLSCDVSVRTDAAAGAVNNRTAYKDARALIGYGLQLTGYPQICTAPQAARVLTVFIWPQMGLFASI
jgi:hypothetical protein